MKLIDISQEVFSCVVFGDDPAPSAQCLCRMEEGALYNLSAFSMCAHNGTHIDAPYHFLAQGKAIDAMMLDAFVGDCYVARLQGDVTAADAERVLQCARAVGAGERILLAGELVVTADAARVFAAAGIKLIGNESQTVGPEQTPMEVHHILLGAEVALLEGIRLADVAEGRYFLSAAPLNLAGFEGAPCRAYLIES